MFLSIISDKFQFHFVFLIALRYVDKTSSLAQIIQFQHNLSEVDTEHIESILKGETNHRVLLLLDGYDEYIYMSGGNRDIDEAIESKVGNCLIILTSRPENKSEQNMLLYNTIKNKMDGEIAIEWLSDEDIEEEGTQTISIQAEKMRLIFMLPLQHSKLNLYGNFFRLIMDYTTRKKFGCNTSDIPNVEQWLSYLGKLSWNALQKDTGQWFLDKVKAKFLSFIVIDFIPM